MEVNRIALNSNQIEEFNPPPNPAKLSDSRATAYIAEFGAESWELDALEPQVMIDLVRNTIESFIDEDLWKEMVKKEDEAKKKLNDIVSDLEEE